MNTEFYKSAAWQDRETAEVMLADMMKQTAKREREAALKRDGKHTAPSQSSEHVKSRLAPIRDGFIHHMRAFVATQSGTFGRADAIKAFPEKTPSQISTSLGDMRMEGRIKTVGKGPNGVNIYLTTPLGREGAK
jgi:hypothetical protein